MELLAGSLSLPIVYYTKESGYMTPSQQTSLENGVPGN